MSQSHAKTKLIKTLVHDIVGLERFTACYNKNAKSIGIPCIQVQTMHRYTNGGKGYENGPPQRVCDYAKRWMYGVLSTDSK